PPLGPESRSWLASADALIVTLAHRYRDRTVAIVLSGMMGAAVEGVRRVRACGGVTMAQDRISFLFFEMPSAAIDFGKAEFFGSPSQMARALEVLAEQWQPRAARVHLDAGCSSTLESINFSAFNRNRLKAG
ncbi:MAG TPA: chemotaxis protein CheB, partial [Rhodomicrobium sp.]|nr:chemotaxis protein CheB [Rhodomicrobium sp.]